MSRARRHLPHRIRRYSGQEYSLVFGRGKSAGWSYPQLQLVGRPDLVEGLMHLILRPLHSNNPPHPRRTHMLRLCGLQPQSVDPQVRLLLVRFTMLHRAPSLSCSTTISRRLAPMGAFFGHCVAPFCSDLDRPTLLAPLLPLPPPLRVLLGVVCKASVRLALDMGRGAD